MSQSIGRTQRERDRLEQCSKRFSSEEGFNARLIDYRFEAMRPWLSGSRECLELGPADGRMTRRLVEVADVVTAVDGSLDYVNILRTRLPQVNAVHALFEEYVPDRVFDRVLMCHVLEHVEDPVSLLHRSRDWIAPGGLLIASVPNAMSIHRQVGVRLGMLRSVTDLDEADLRIGHRRVYTRESFCADIAAAGYTIREVMGVFFKPLSNAQIEETWSEELMDAFYYLGFDYPDLCAELLVVAEVQEAPGLPRGDASDK